MSKQEMTPNTHRALNSVASMWHFEGKAWVLLELELFKYAGHFMLPGREELGSCVVLRRIWNPGLSGTTVGAVFPNKSFSEVDTPIRVCPRIRTIRTNKTIRTIEAPTAGGGGNRMPGSCVIYKPLPFWGLQWNRSSTEQYCLLGKGFPLCYNVLSNANTEDCKDGGCVHFLPSVFSAICLESFMTPQHWDKAKY